ncbi:MAG: hypothetical protein U0946_00805 [Patescibacteria group bacterium]|nr:hypothetical protein [Patescibacteria group bacterium]
MAIINNALPTVTTGQHLGIYISIIWRVLVIVGGLMVLLQLIWGALNWILSGANPERLKKAKDQMFNGIFGLVILILSFAIVKIIETITGLKILNPTWPTL